MNDPHVEYLEYRIEHGPGIDWSKATPVNFAGAGIAVEVDNQRVRFRFTTHHSSEAGARTATEQNWTATYNPDWPKPARARRSSLTTYLPGKCMPVCCGARTRSPSIS